MKAKYIVEKHFGHDQGFSCAFRQPKAESHCNKLHGYALAFTLRFESTTLDANNWVINFGGLKAIKAYITDHFDHTTAIAMDDPYLGEFRNLHEQGVLDLRTFVFGVGCEQFAKVVFDYTKNWLEEHREQNVFRNDVRLVRVEVREHAGNMAAYEES